MVDEHNVKRLFYAYFFHYNIACTKVQSWKTEYAVRYILQQEYSKKRILVGQTYKMTSHYVCVSYELTYGHGVSYVISHVGDWSISISPITVLIACINAWTLKVYINPCDGDDCIKCLLMHLHERRDIDYPLKLLSFKFEL